MAKRNNLIDHLGKTARRANPGTDWWLCFWAFFEEIYQQVWLFNFSVLSGNHLTRVTNSFSGSTGLATKSFIPASIQARWSSSKTLTVSASIGRCACSLISGIKALFQKTRRYRVSDFRGFSPGSYRNLIELCPQQLPYRRSSTKSCVQDKRCQASGLTAAIRWHDGFH